MGTTPERARASRRKHYRANSDVYKARASARKAVIRAILDEARDKPCMDCGGVFPVCAMDLDHRPGEDKAITPSAMVARGWSDERVQAEIAKCDVVCANCHRIRTAIRGNWHSMRL